MKTNKVKKIFRHNCGHGGLHSHWFFAAKLGMSASAGMSKEALVVLGLLFIPLFFIAIAIHEAGHAVAGIRMHFNFKTYIVGPFMWEKSNSEWRFQWNKNINTAGGMVICLPQDTVNLTNRFAVYAAGGPIASLLFAVVNYVGYLAIPTAHTATEILRDALFITAVLSLIIFITTAVPLRANGFSSDGSRVLRLLQRGDTAKFELIILKLITNTAAGVRPRDMDSNELNDAFVLAKN